MSRAGSNNHQNSQQSSNIPQEKRGVQNAPKRKSQLEALRELHKIHKIKDQEINALNKASSQQANSSQNNKVQPSSNKSGLQNPNKKSLQHNQSQSQMGSQMNSLYKNSPDSALPQIQRSQQSPKVFHKSQFPGGQQDNNVRVSQLNPLKQKMKKAEQKQFQELRVSMHNCMVRLESLDTRDIAMKEMQQLIQRNRGPHVIRLIFSMMNEAKRITSVLSKEAEVLLLGYIAQIYGRTLLDSLDKAPSFGRAIYRLVELIQSYFSYHNINIQVGCSKAWTDVYRSCFKKDSIEQKYKYLIQPLLQMIRGGAMVVLQETSIQVLYDFLRILVSEQDEELLELLVQDVIELFLQSKSHFQNLVKSVGFILTKCPFESFAPFVYQLLEKLAALTDDPSVDYRIKVELCKVLQILGNLFMEKQQVFIGFSMDYLIKRLQELSRDRILKVQLVARECLKLWMKLQDQHELNQAKKQRQIYQLDPDELIRMKVGDMDDENRSQMESDDDQKGVNRYQKQKYDNADLISQLSLQRKDQLSFQRGIDILKSNDIIEKTDLKQRGHNYQKKRSGTGGGFIRKIDRENNKNAHKSYNQMKSEMRAQVLQDRINFVENRRKNKQFRAVDGDNNSMQAGIEIYLPKTKEERLNKQREAMEIEEEQEVTSRKQDSRSQIQNNQNVEIQGKFNTFQKEKQTDLKEQNPEKFNSNSSDQNQDHEQDIIDETTSQDLDEQAKLQNQEKPDIMVQDYSKPVQVQEKYQIAQPDHLQDTMAMYDSTGSGEQQENYNLADTMLIQQDNQNSEEQYDNDQYEQQQVEYEPTEYYRSATEDQQEFMEPYQQDYHRTFQQAQTQHIGQYQEEEEEALDEMAYHWNRALHQLKDNDINGAYKTILETEDDLYLVRLMTRTGVCYEQLDQDLARQLAEKVAEVAKTKFVDSLLFEFMTQGCGQGLFQPDQMRESLMRQQEAENILLDLNRKLQSH